VTSFLFGLTLVWIIHQEITQLWTCVSTTSTHTFHTFNVHNSFPSLLANYYRNLEALISLGCIPRSFATFWVFPLLRLNVAAINKTFFFTNDMLDYTNLFASIDIFKLDKTSCCALARCAGKIKLGRQWLNLGCDKTFSITSLMHFGPRQGCKVMRI
jgi:hypothetical protein